MINVNNSNSIHIINHYSTVFAYETTVLFLEPASKISNAYDLRKHQTQTRDGFSNI